MILFVTFAIVTVSVSRVFFTFARTELERQWFQFFVCSNSQPFRGSCCDGLFAFDLDRGNCRETLGHLLTVTHREPVMPRSVSNNFSTATSCSWECSEWGARSSTAAEGTIGSLSDVEGSSNLAV